MLVQLFTQKHRTVAKKWHFQMQKFSVKISHLILSEKTQCTRFFLQEMARDSTSTPKSWGFFKVTCCIGSKARAARLVLLWNFAAVILAYRMFYNIDVVDHTSLVLMLLSVVQTIFTQNTCMHSPGGGGGGGGGPAASGVFRRLSRVSVLSALPVVARSTRS